VRAETNKKSKQSGDENSEKKLIKHLPLKVPLAVMMGINFRKEIRTGAVPSQSSS
jgi:hypothetical protein